jgi:hypothetical protein
MIAAGVVRRSSTLAAAIVLSSGIVAASDETSPAGAPVARIAISFKMDAVLFGGSYGGERWISGPKYSSAARQGKEVTIEAKVRGLDAGGKAAATRPVWVPADPEMVVVSPVSGAELDHVRLTVKKVGESKLRVVSQGVSKDLLVTAKAVGSDAMQVTITQ